MERREVLKIAASLGVLGVAGKFVTACSSSTTSSTTTKPVVTDGSTAGTAAPTSTAAPKPMSYGPLGEPDVNGLRLPSGFSSRIIGTSGQPVAGTSYVWHPDPDGGAVFATDDGGWIYVSNSESGPATGGASMVRFSKSGDIVEARRILADTARNCAGGATPWGTWLSCEEIPKGRVFESWPLEERPGEARPAMGQFNHEAVAVHEKSKTLFLTEDMPDGGFYRFTPTSYPDVSAGKLEVMTEEGGKIGWAAVPDPLAESADTRLQVPTTKRFSGGEGICIHDDIVYFTTKGDNRVWRYDPAAEEVSVFYDAAASAAPVLRGVDNIVASEAGALFVAEDGDDMQLVQLFGTTVEPVVQVMQAPGSEMTGPAFSPDGKRLYFSSQRGPGITYEVTGPWVHA